LPVMDLTGLAGIWVRLPDWVLDEACLPKPVPGTVLKHIGIRVHGALERADDTAEDGVIAESEPSAADPRTPVYRVTARVESSRPLEVDTGLARIHR
jgi:hypothetical protein